MKSSYIASLIIVNGLLLIALIANIVFTYCPNLHQAFQNATGTSGALIPFYHYWKYYIVQVVLSPILSLLFTPLVYLGIKGEEDEK